MIKNIFKFTNRKINLSLLTVLLAALQSYLFHIGTSCYGHDIFSAYFFIELFIFLLIIFTHLENKLSVLLYFTIFLFETIYFILNERPFRPDIMLIIGVIRIYIFVLLFKMIRNRK